MIYWEFDEEKTEELIKKWLEIDVLRKEYPNRYPIGLHLSQSPNGDSNMFYENQPPRGFGIYEGTEEQYNNWKKHYCPPLRIVARGVPEHQDTERSIDRQGIFYVTDYVIEYRLARMRDEPSSHRDIIRRLRERAEIIQWLHEHEKRT